MVVHHHSIFVVSQTTILCYHNVSRCIVTYFLWTKFQIYLYCIKDLSIFSIANSLFHLKNWTYKQHLHSSSENNVIHFHLKKCLCLSLHLMNCHHILDGNHLNHGTSNLWRICSTLGHNINPTMHTKKLTIAWTYFHLMRYIVAIH